LTLAVPGGGSSTVTPYPGSNAVGDANGNSIPDVTLKFDRPSLVSAIQSGINAKVIDPAKPVALTLYAGDHPIATSMISIKP
jgi:hypothetical protein